MDHRLRSPGPYRTCAGGWRRSPGQPTAEQSTGGLNERSGHGDLVGVAGAEQQPARSAGLIREAMELGRPPGGRRIPRRTQLIAASREVSKRQH